MDITKNLFGKKQEGNKNPAHEQQQEAKKNLGQKNVFGADEWKKFFGNAFQVKVVPEIPWSMDVLKNPGINQEHFLFLGLNVLGGEPLNIPAWNKLRKDKDHPKLLWTTWNKHAFTQRTCELRWYFLSMSFGNHWGPYNNLVSLLPDGYEVPGSIELVTATILYHLLNKKYPDTGGAMANTSDKTDKGHRVIFRISEDEGAKIVDNFHLDDSNDMVEKLGIAASRKLP